MCTNNLNSQLHRMSSEESQTPPGSLKNQSVGLEVQRAVALGTKRVARRGDGVFSGATVSVLFLDLGASLAGVFTNTSLIQHPVPEILNSVRDPGAQMMISWI